MYTMVGNTFILSLGTFDYSKYFVMNNTLFLIISSLTQYVQAAQLKYLVLFSSNFQEILIIYHWLIGPILILQYSYQFICIFLHQF